MRIRWVQFPLAAQRARVQADERDCNPRWRGAIPRGLSGRRRDERPSLPTRAAAAPGFSTPRAPCATHGVWTLGRGAQASCEQESSWHREVPAPSLLPVLADPGVSLRRNLTRRNSEREDPYRFNLLASGSSADATNVGCGRFNSSRGDRRNGAKEARRAHNADIGRRNPGTCNRNAIQDPAALIRRREWRQHPPLRPLVCTCRARASTWPRSVRLLVTAGATVDGKRAYRAYLARPRPLQGHGRRAIRLARTAGRQVIRPVAGAGAYRSVSEGRSTRRRPTRDEAASEATGTTRQARRGRYPDSARCASNPAGRGGSPRAPDTRAVQVQLLTAGPQRRFA